MAALAFSFSVETKEGIIMNQVNGKKKNDGE